MAPAGKAAPSENPEVVDSATAVQKDNDKSKAPVPAKGGGKGKGGGSGPPSSSKSKTESKTSKATPGYAEGNAALLSYGLSLSGYRERVLSPFKTDKYFHMVSQSYQRLISVKPSITSRFTYEEFCHCSALQLYQRMENVKFDALGIKPSAPTRVPLPRNLRVFQPLWSILANIGTVDDEELRVQYIPDGILPDSDDLDSEHDIEGLLSCTLYDWKTSWEQVKSAREQRPSFQTRDGYVTEPSTNEPPLEKKDLIKKISEAKKNARLVANALENDIAVEYDNAIYYYPKVDTAVATATDDKGRTNGNYVEFNGAWYDQSLDKAAMKRRTRFKTEDDYLAEVEDLMQQAKRSKRERITPRFDIAYQSSSYKISDGTVASNPGAYGSRLHWDPQLWLDYENFVNEVASVAMFSLSMPVETTGSYAWILPVEKRLDNPSAVFVKLPKASIPTQTWVLAMLLQSSTLPLPRRSTWYTETDTLTNITGLRLRYIQAAIKTASPVEQYGTI